MEISRTMDLGQLAEHMGSVATIDDAQAMRDLLIVREYNRSDTSDIPESAWLSMVDEAAMSANTLRRIQRAESELVAALADIADVRVWDGSGRISDYAPDLTDYDGDDSPGSEWDEECDRLLEEIREALPAGWIADWSDDDIIIDRE